MNQTPLAPIYLTANQAIHYIADESQWGASKAREVTSEGLRKNVLLEAPEEFRQRAAEGKVRVYGASPTTHEHALIDKTHWMTFQLDHASIFREDAEGKTEMAGFEGGFYGRPGHTLLQIEAEDVYRTWPKERNAGTVATPLRVIVGTAGNYVEAKNVNLYGIRRTVQVGVRNDGNSLLSNCKLLGKTIDPKTGAVEEWQLTADTFSLNSDEQKYIAVA
jgi:hypothetical protein